MPVLFTRTVLPPTAIGPVIVVTWEAHSAELPWMLRLPPTTVMPDNPLMSGNERLLFMSMSTTTLVTFAKPSTATSAELT